MSAHISGRNLPHRDTYPAHVPHGQTAIDDGLSARIPNTNAAQDNDKIVTNQCCGSSLANVDTRADHLCTPLVSAIAEQSKPSAMAVFSYEGERGLDLAVLETR